MRNEKKYVGDEERERMMMMMRSMMFDPSGCHSTELYFFLPTTHPHSAFHPVSQNLTNPVVD